MAKSKTKESCFIIMPITTPEQLIEQYKGDANHFVHVLEHLFIPALKEAGFNPISPKSTGSNVIQADIIKQLSSCELVLCDMSILNPNVFYEFGIRTALDKPVALVVDNKTEPIPFDTSILNFHIYDSSMAPWILEDQKKELTKHVQEAYKKSKDHNALWKYFGVAQTGTFKPEEAEMGEKLDLIMQELSGIKLEQRESEYAKRIAEFATAPIKNTWGTGILPSILKKQKYKPLFKRIYDEQQKQNIRNVFGNLPENQLNEIQEIIESIKKESVEKDTSQEPDSSNN